MANTATAASQNWPAPSRMPMVSAQNMYTVSSGSFTAVRKRTMDSAPTMPMESWMDSRIHMTTGVVIRVIKIRVRAKLLEYITPR